MESAFSLGSVSSADKNMVWDGLCTLAWRIDIWAATPCCDRTFSMLYAETDDREK
jgi:hypothetical protein